MDAGALNEAVWEKLVQTEEGRSRQGEGLLDHPALRRLCLGGPGDLDKGLVERIASALLKLDSKKPEDKRLLDLHRTKKYVRVKAEDFKPVEEAAIAAGLLK